MSLLLPEAVGLHAAKSFNQQEQREHPESIKLCLSHLTEKRGKAATHIRPTLRETPNIVYWFCFVRGKDLERTYTFQRKKEIGVDQLLKTD